MLLLAFAAITLRGYSQKLKEHEVPSAVKESFYKTYPGLKDVSWEKEKDGNFEAEFKSGGKEQSVVLDSKGAILETETEIAVAELPATVQEYIAKTYKDAKIKEAARITDAKGVISYEAEVKGSDLLFDAKGNFIKALNK